MRSLLIIGALALAVAGTFWLHQRNSIDVSVFCNPEEVCFREWLGQEAAGQRLSLRY